MSGRIRTVKPEWLEDERLAFASAAARVLSISLMLLADDYGNGRGNVAWLRGQAFPGDDSVEGTRSALHELVKLRFVILYEIDGQSYFAIRNWDKHQRVDRPGKPRVPAPLANNLETTANVRVSHATELGHDHDHDHDHDLDQELTPVATASAPARTPDGSPESHPAATTERPPRRKPKSSIPKTWTPKPRHLGKATERNIDCALAAEKFRGHAESVDRKCADWDRAFDNWLLNERPPPRATSGPVDFAARRARLQSEGR